jgi:hypothetical protein
MLEMIPFEEALQEMQSGPPRNDQLSRISSEIPLLFAVAALFALYFAG